MAQLYVARVRLCPSLDFGLFPEAYESQKPKLLPRVYIATGSLTARLPALTGVFAKASSTMRLASVINWLPFMFAYGFYEPASMLARHYRPWYRRRTLSPPFIAPIVAPCFPWNYLDVFNVWCEKNLVKVYGFRRLKRRLQLEKCDLIWDADAG